jgi:hypothetical protein
MQRIIYLDTSTGYKTLDVRDTAMLQKHQQQLTRKGKFIVCVIDLNLNVLLLKCDSYDSHEKFVESCCHLKPNSTQSIAS